jgi:hypothetical protein
MLLLLPFLLIPHGSGGLLSRKALHATTRLNQYHDEDDDEDDEDGAQQAQQGQPTQQGQDEEEGAPAAVGGGGGISSSLTQPLLEPAGMERGAFAAATGGTDGSGGSSTLPAGSTPAAKAAGLAGALPEFSPVQCLRLPDFWLLFLVLTIGMGAGLTLLNNLAQIIKALAGPTDATPVLVSLFSVCNCAGEAAGVWESRGQLFSQRALLCLPAVCAVPKKSVSHKSPLINPHL